MKTTFIKSNLRILRDLESGVKHSPFLTNGLFLIKTFQVINWSNLLLEDSFYLYYNANIYKTFNNSKNLS